MSGPISTPIPAPLHTTSTPALPVVADLGTLADLERFTRRFDALTLQFSVAFDSLMSGELSQAEFANGLEHMQIPQWTVLSVELATPPQQNNSVLRTNTDAQLQQVSTSWIQALSLYAQGLRDHDHREVLQAFDIMRDAERYNFESEALLQRLEAHR
jgi:hypothetical protein